MSTAATKYDQIQQQILTLLRWDATQHGQFIYDCGLSFLNYYIKDESPYIISCILRSRIFWNWWKLEWYTRDQAYATHFYKLMHMDCNHELYFDLHDPKTLAHAIYPNGVVLEESYALMINELNKEAVLQ